MKINYEKEKGLRIECTFEGDVQEYAMMWLNLTNNIREHKEFYWAKNYSDNDITLLCTEDSEEEVADYLDRLGLVINEMEKVTVVLPYVDYDNKEEYEYEFAKVED